MIKGQCCGKCAYFMEIADDTGRGLGKGHCRYNPPQVVAIHTLSNQPIIKGPNLEVNGAESKVNVRISPVYPMMVAEDLGCGQYRERERVNEN